MSTSLQLSVKQGACVPGLATLQLAALAKSLELSYPEGHKVVFFGPQPPFDRTLPWQETGATGNPIGAIRYYSANSWIEGQVIANPPEKGNPGERGPQGDAGPQGPQGETGPAGPKGDTGPAGPSGVQGNMGPQGPQGVRGEPGPTGPQGNTGATGPTGQPGPSGPAGTSLISGNGAPVSTVGDEGSFYLDAVFPYALYGPKSGGQWGPAVPLDGQGPPIDLAGGTSLLLNKKYSDTFTASRVMTAFPAPGTAYAKITLHVWATTGAIMIDFHTNNVVYEKGQGASPMAAAFMAPAGASIIELEYVNSRWILAS